MTKSVGKFVLVIVVLCGLGAAGYYNRWDISVTSWLDQRAVAARDQAAVARAAEQDRLARIVHGSEYFADTGLLSEHPLLAYREFKSTETKKEGDLVLGTGHINNYTVTSNLVDFDTEISGIIMPRRDVSLDLIERQVVNDDQPETIQFVFTPSWLNKVVKDKPQTERLDYYIKLWGSEREPSNISNVIVKIHRSKTGQLFQP